MLTKEVILEKAGGEVALISHLVPEFDPSVRKKNYESIFSEKDDHPSMSIYQDKGTWKFKSFNTGHQGDCFRMWADYYGLNCSTQFKELLELINQEMLLGLETEKKSKLSFKPIFCRSSVVKLANRSLPSQTLSIDYIPYGDSGISKLHLQYWAQYGITQSILERFQVKQVGFLSYTSNAGRTLSFHYREKNQIVSAYDIEGRIKVYIPEISSTFYKDLCFNGQKKSFSYKNQTKDDIFGLASVAFWSVRLYSYYSWRKGLYECLCPWFY